MAIIHGAQATASVLKLKENNYEAAEIEFLITTGQEGLAWLELGKDQTLAMAWKCLQIN